MYVSRVNLTLVTREDPLLSILQVNRLLMTTASSFWWGSSVICNDVFLDVPTPSMNIYGSLRDDSRNGVVAFFPKSVKCGEAKNV
jgi:hypothetical protein